MTLKWSILADMGPVMSGENLTLLFRIRTSSLLWSLVVVVWWFGEKLLKWPSQSPDLNPIELLWQDLKSTAHAQRPTNVTELRQFCRAEWAKIPPWCCKTPTNNSRKHLIAVITAKGGVKRSYWKEGGNHFFIQGIRCWISFLNKYGKLYCFFVPSESLLCISRIRFMMSFSIWN